MKYFHVIDLVPLCTIMHVVSIKWVKFDEDFIFKIILEIINQLYYEVCGLCNYTCRLHMNRSTPALTFYFQWTHKHYPPVKID